MDPAHHSAMQTPHPSPPDRLADAPVERGAFAQRLCADLGTRGVALEGRVFLAPGADARVLAHELAHIAQQRLWCGRGVPHAWTEAEAHACALTGHAPRLPLDPRVPACWEEVGHYYTVYYVLFAAGVRDDLARRIAFYAQMPDEISDLDAVRAGLAMPADSAVGAGAWLREQTIGRAEDAYVWMNNGLAAMLPYGSGYMGHRRPPRAFEDFARGLDVQTGLHVLNGMPAEAETGRRNQILRTIDPVTQTMEFGLALHAFGDCYAHREADGARMFGPVTGHAADSLQARGQAAAHVPEMHVHPDAVGPHHGELYLRYANDMLRIFLQVFPSGVRSGPALDPARLTANLRGVVAASNAAADTEAEHQRQIIFLRTVARSLVPAGMHPYDPENQEDVPIGDFRPATDIVVTQHDIQVALRRANGWSRGN